MANQFAQPWIVVLLFVGGCAGPSNQPSKVLQSKTKQERFLGVNLASVVDWSSEWPFADVYKTSRTWMEKGPGPFTYDAGGNPLLRPGQSVETLMFRDLNGHYPPGDYVATYEGTGEVEIKEYDIERIVSAEQGRIVFRVKPDNGGILLKILSSSPRDPIRNIRVWAPGLEDTKSHFHPLFLERLKTFRVLRFMDWQRTNGSPQVDWAQRPKPTDARFSTDAGVPLEVMIDLANVTKSHPWFCIPHQADDEYVHAFAKLIKEKLDPSLPAYIEYSNEVWNFGFAQCRYAEQRGKKLGFGDRGHLHHYARRSGEIFDIFTTVFGGNDRFIRVLSGQFANPRDCEFMLNCDDIYKKADALGVGAYFGYEFGAPKSVDATLKLLADDIVHRCGQEIDGTHRELIRRHVAIAKKHNLRLIAYEGGQHLVGHGGAEDNKELEDLLVSVNRHPRMAMLYRQQITHWFKEGGGVFTAYGHIGRPSKWGSWGLLEYQDQDIQQAPKYRAICEMAGELTGK